MTDTFNFPYKKAYSSFVEFKTLVDEKFSGREQRRNQWSNPRRKWQIELDLNKINREELVSFFIAQKGKFRSFYFKWEINKGGDGQTYLVRFDTDEINFNVLPMGYSTLSIPIIQVFE